MKKFAFLAGFAFVALTVFLTYASAAKEKSDKERIVQLEMQVGALNEAVSDLSMDLAGAHQWAMSVNSRLQSLETRGPVAKLRQPVVLLPQ